jgi:hypothetical protein
VQTKTILDDDPFLHFDHLIADPIAAHIMRPKGIDREPVGVQAGGSHPIQPGGLDDMDPAGGACPKNL